CSPLVLGNQGGHVLPEPEVLFAQLQQLGADRLDEASHADRLLEAGRLGAAAELQSGGVWVRAQGPPDLLSIVYAASADEQPEVVLVLAVGGEVRRDARAWEARPDDASV